MIMVYALGATLGVSLLSLVGVVTLAIHQEKLQRVLDLFVSLSAGTMLGAVFIHLLPEAATQLHPDLLFKITLFSFVAFFLIEKLLHWQHCHKQNCDVHSFGYMNIIGDGLHNLIDGLVIVGAFQANIELGLVTTTAIILHEIPQEIGDFGVLLHAGFSTQQAILFNLLSALAAVVGALMGLFLFEMSSILSVYLLPVAAGGFLYIGASDLLPELRKEKNGRRMSLTFAIFIIGIAVMLFIKE